jgi:hypothetical protein
MDTELSLPLTLKPRRLKLLGYFLMFILFTATGLWMAGERPFAGYFWAVVFGLSALVMLGLLLPSSSYLRLTSTGFTFCSLFRSHTVRWNDVERFSVVRLHRNKMVAWRYSAGYQARRTARLIADSLTGAEAALPDTYGLTAEELADQMNRLIEKYGAEDQASDCASNEDSSRVGQDGRRDKAPGRRTRRRASATRRTAPPSSTQ